MAGSREQFGSKLGFILAAAGSAVGIGNLVGFPVGLASGRLALDYHTFYDCCILFGHHSLDIWLFI